METIALPLKSDADVQTMTLAIEPDGNAVTLRVELRYLSAPGKWYMSVFNAATDECLVSYIPLIASGEKLNDLLGQFGHLCIGSAACVPVSATAAGRDPSRDTLTDYELLWGDCLAKH